MEYPPETGGGGIGSYVANMGAALARRGHQVHVLSCVPGQSPSDRRDDEVYIHRRGALDLKRLDRLVRSGKARLRLEIAAACFLEHRRLGLDVDVIESPDWMAEGLVFAAFRSRPHVAHLHTPLLVLARHNDRPSTWDRRLGDALERITVRRADVVTSPSYLLARDLERSGWLRPGTAEVVRLPVDLEQWAGLSAAETTGPCVLAVGRLEPRKAPEVLVEAAAELASEVEGLEVLFVGGSNYERDGKPYRDWTEALARELGAPCRFLNPVPRTELPSIYGQARVAVLTARYDNFPVAGLEAMAAERPLVCTTTTGVAELVTDARAGLVVRPRDPRALAQALLPYLLDPSRAGEDGRRARAVVTESCSPERIAAAREAVYEEAIARWQRRRVRIRPAGRRADRRKAPRSV
jgi:glycogen(starch) synthase